MWIDAGLDRLITIGDEVLVARRTESAAVKLAERARARLDAAAARAQQLPPQYQQTGHGRPDERVERIAGGELPAVRQRDRAHARDVLVGRFGKVTRDMA